MTRTTKRDPRAQGFTSWRLAVERIILERTGMHADDLPDWRYVMDYEEGYTPKQTASRAIRNAKDI